MYMLERSHRVSSDEYPKSMLRAKNKKKYVIPCKQQFCYKKVLIMSISYEVAAIQWITSCHK